MVNFGPLAAEIGPVIWGSPANFNGFHVYAALLHDTLVVGISQTAALNKGRHVYSAGLPSRWALAHISSLALVLQLDFPVMKCPSDQALFHNIFRHMCISSLSASSINFDEISFSLGA